MPATDSPPGTPPGEDNTAGSNHGTENPMPFHRIVELAQKALTQVTDLTDRTKKKSEILDTINNLLHGLSAYAFHRVANMDGTIEGIQTSIAKTVEVCTTIENKIELLQANVAATKTYAQAAASTPAPTKPPKGVAKLQQEEQARKENAKYAITLTAKAATEEVKKKLADADPGEIKSQCQKSIDLADIPSKPNITSINKLTRDQLRLQIRTIEQANHLRNTSIDWDSAYEGLKLHKPLYPIVVHRVRTDAINFDIDHSETIKDWETENQSRDIKITRVRPLRRQAKHVPKAHRSLIVYTEDKDAANKCLELGFIIDSMRHKVEKFAPDLYIHQCFQCHGFGHNASQCKRKHKCGKCGKEDHPTADCSSTPHCVNCDNDDKIEKKDHPAWDVKCPTRAAVCAHLTTLRANAINKFT
jgi:hypothetical protein